MSSVVELLADDVIAELAKPAQIKSGKALLEGDAVEIEEFNSSKVMARVRGLTADAVTRRTELDLDGAVLHWRCTCTSNKSNFCKHLVATVLAARRTVL